MLATESPRRLAARMSFRDDTSRVRSHLDGAFAGLDAFLSPALAREVLEDEKAADNERSESTDPTELLRA